MWPFVGNTFISFRRKIILSHMKNTSIIFIARCGVSPFTTRPNTNPLTRVITFRYECFCGTIYLTVTFERTTASMLIIFTCPISSSDIFRLFIRDTFCMRFLWYSFQILLHFWPTLGRIHSLQCFQFNKVVHWTVRKASRGNHSPWCHMFSVLFQIDNTILFSKEGGLIWLWKHKGEKLKFTYKPEYLYVR